MGDDSNRTAIVILGAQHPTGLLTARALRSQPSEIIGVGYFQSECLRSNIWHRLIIIKNDQSSILSTIEMLAKEYSTVYLFPSDDESVLTVASNKDSMPANIIFLLPELDTVMLLLDKNEFNDWAEQHGFDVPLTLNIRNFDELKEGVSKIGYPLILKPVYRNRKWDICFPNNKVFIVERAEDECHLPTNLFDVAPLILCQQYIPGGDDNVYFCLVRYDSKMQMANYYCGRKLMQWPPLGGSTAIAISDDLDETRDVTKNIFDKVGYCGLGSIEYKKHPSNSKFYIMEPTVGRNDFQSQLAVSGGVNLTLGLYQDMLGGSYTGHYKRKAVWFSEVSVLYGIKYYASKHNFYYLKYMLKFIRHPGFSHFNIYDVKPFACLIRKILKALLKW